MLAHRDSRPGGATIGATASPENTVPVLLAAFATSVSRALPAHHRWISNQLAAVHIWAVQTGRILETSPAITSIHWSRRTGRTVSARAELAPVERGRHRQRRRAGDDFQPWRVSPDFNLALSFQLWVITQESRSCRHVRVMHGNHVDGPVALLFLVVFRRMVPARWVCRTGAPTCCRYAGPITAAPLLLLFRATQRLRLSTVGLIQYLTPTL